MVENAEGRQRKKENQKYDAEGLTPDVSSLGLKHTGRRFTKARKL